MVQYHETYAISKIHRFAHSNDKILDACKVWLRNIWYHACSLACTLLNTIGRYGATVNDDVDFRFVQRFAQEELWFTMKQGIQQYPYPLNPTAKSFGGFNK